MATLRARILQRPIVIFYSALGIFVATSIAIAFVVVSGSTYVFLPIITGISGACLLFYAGITLIYEARISLQTVNGEMNFIWHLAELHAPNELEEHTANQ